MKHLAKTDVTPKHRKQTTKHLKQTNTNDNQNKDTKSIILNQGQTTFKNKTAIQAFILQTVQTNLECFLK